MYWVVRFLTAGFVVYAVFVFSVYVLQRRLIYFPTTAAKSPAECDLPDARSFRLKTTDGERIVTWYQAAARDHLLFVYFHGNGGSLADRAGIFKRFASDGSGFLAIDYRGYGGSTGAPSEQGLVLDGEAAYRKVVALGYSPDRIVLVGESLGTGVAVDIASNHPIRALILDSSFSSTIDVAALDMLLLPVGLLMKDRFDSFSKIKLVKAPKLFLHGEKDPIIPISLSRKLFEEADPPKTFLELPGRGHVVLFGPDIPDMVRTWLAGLPPPEGAHSSFSTR